MLSLWVIDPFGDTVGVGVELILSTVAPLSPHPHPHQTPPPCSSSTVQSMGVAAWLSKHYLALASLF